MYLFLKVQYMLIVLHRNTQKESKVWKDLNMLQATIVLPVPRNQTNELRHNDGQSQILK